MRAVPPLSRLRRWLPRALLPRTDRNGVIRLLPATATPRVALTFDDGPHAVTTSPIVDILVDAGVTATFFVLGENIEPNPEPLRRAIEAGMAIGVHSWGHARLAEEDDDFVRTDLTRTLDMLRSFDADPTVFRPPHGDATPRLVELAGALGLRTVTWDVDSEDWRRPGPDAITDSVVAHARDRSIILLHDGGGDRSQTVAALPAVISRLRERGLSFATL